MNPAQYQHKPLLHGRLDVEIRSAEGLPDMEGWLSKVVDKGDVTDPYVDVRLGNAKIAKTRFDVVTSMFPCVCFKEVLLGAFDADDKFFEVFFRPPRGCFCSFCCCC